jgi:allantoate deiminase
VFSADAGVVRFVAIGDQGKGNDNQRRVGAAIGKHCAAKGCDFVVLLGDNFYPSGVASTSDPQWQSAFVTPYESVNVPFYAVLGNHDYGADGMGTDLPRADAELAYGSVNPKWRMPAAHYRFRRGDVEFFVADTNRSMFALYQDARRDFETWLTESTAPWKIVFAHHPYKSNGRHGNAGNYDGPLGVLLGVAVAARLRDVALPFHLAVVGFSDEEGVRYQTTYLGSRAMLGLLTKKDLQIIEEKGIEKARRPHGEFLAYLEAHIEQGPSLEEQNKPLGVVTAIAGQTRISADLTGRAGHAGTTPMNLRRDALCGAAELILAAENIGVIATVGQCEVTPGASNVIPGLVSLTLDVRDADDVRRKAACAKLKREALRITKRRGLRLHDWHIVQETPCVRMDPAMTRILRRAAGRVVPALPSGAGHDAVYMARLAPAGMIFIPCKDGISHNEIEDAKPEHITAGCNVLLHAMLERAGLAFGEHPRDAK